MKKKYFLVLIRYVAQSDDVNTKYIMIDEWSVNNIPRLIRDIFCLAPKSPVRDWYYQRYQVPAMPNHNERKTKTSYHIAYCTTIDTWATHSVRLTISFAFFSCNSSICMSSIMTDSSGRWVMHKYLTERHSTNKLFETILMWWTPNLFDNKQLPFRTVNSAHAHTNNNK